MNDMTPLYWTLLLLRYLHILSAIALMGSTIFAYFAVAPSLGELSGTDSAKFHAALRTRWSKFVMIATGLLLVTGIANMLIYPMYFDLGDMRGQYSMWTGIKFLLALPIFFFAALLTGRSSLAQKIQANARTYLAINLLLALSMVLIGGALRFVDRHPKEDQLEEPLSRSLLPEGTLSRSLEGASLPVGGTY